MKFQVGDRVRCFRGPDKGKTGVVVEIDGLGGGVVLVMIAPASSWWFHPADLKLEEEKPIRPKMKLVDKGGHFAMEPV